LSTIKNTTKKPISVPLPHGKRLFLGPGKSGEIGNKASDHPPLVALIESGDLELVQVGGKRGKLGGSGGRITGGGQRSTPDKGVFRSGDG